MNTTNGAMFEGLSLSRLLDVLSDLKSNPLLAEPASYADVRLVLKDDEHEYRVVVAHGTFCSVDQDVSHVSHPIDFTVFASNMAWSNYLTELPKPESADIMGMITEGRAVLTGDSTKFFPAHHCSRT
jgi:hypothetical protein